MGYTQILKSTGIYSSSFMRFDDTLTEQQRVAVNNPNPGKSIALLGIERYDSVSGGKSDWYVDNYGRTIIVQDGNLTPLYFEDKHNIDLILSDGLSGTNIINDGNGNMCMGIKRNGWSGANTAFTQKILCFRKASTKANHYVKAINLGNTQYAFVTWDPYKTTDKKEFSGICFWCW